MIDIQTANAFKLREALRKYDEAVEKLNAALHGSPYVSDARYLRNKAAWDVAEAVRVFLDELEG